MDTALTFFLVVMGLLTKDALFVVFYMFESNKTSLMCLN